MDEQTVVMNRREREIVLDALAQYEYDNQKNLSDEDGRLIVELGHELKLLNR
jgi:hypothetical protein